MKKNIRRMAACMLTLMLGAVAMAGCGGNEEAAAPMPEETGEYLLDEGSEEYEDTLMYEGTEEFETYSEAPVETAEVQKPAEKAADAGKLSNDEIVELAKKYSGAPVAELDQVMENGNLYIHLYEKMDDHVATVDWYEIDPKTLKGTNFEGAAIDLSGTASSGSEGDEGEGVAIADGEYVTDAEYEGELSADGKTMTITTALSEFVNSPTPSYPKQTYVINVSDSCKCVEVNDESKESSFFDKMDLINDFLKGKSGLPITLKFKNNELVEILFSS